MVSLITVLFVFFCRFFSFASESVTVLRHMKKPLRSSWPVYFEGSTRLSSLHLFFNPPPLSVEFLLNVQPARLGLPTEPNLVPRPQQTRPSCRPMFYPSSRHFFELSFSFSFQNISYSAALASHMGPSETSVTIQCAERRRILRRAACFLCSWRDFLRHAPSSGPLTSEEQHVRLWFLSESRCCVSAISGV